MNNISIILTIYNEEKRIELLLRGLSWCDDIIIINKGSTDRTEEYCKGNNIKLLNFPYTDKDGDLSNQAKKYAKHDWIACVVASDMIDYSLVCKVNNLINDKNFKYNTISVPFKNYILGLNVKHNPWYIKNCKRYFFRKDTLKFSNEVHCEVQYDCKSVYYIKSGGSVYHLTHQSVFSQNERHIRYTQREADILFKKNVSITKLRWQLVKLFLSLLLKNLFIFRNNDIFALNIAYITYYVQRYLFTWEKTQKIEEKYENIRNMIIKDLEETMIK